MSKALIDLIVKFETEIYFTRKSIDGQQEKDTPDEELIKYQNDHLRYYRLALTPLYLEMMKEQ